MNQSTKDIIKGNVHEAKGVVKEKVGKITSNRDLTAEGQNEKLAGKVQKKVGQIEKVLEK
ncbi:MAG TPA: CsbD family protein [Candidatus Angelobacter sp.]|nr:CsbD family protein [Candidatus Angelobacter sp.]